jgi:ornithine cyclodeaminase/alanine dehydrogenase-like protein (mu-crystallin family)
MCKHDEVKVASVTVGIPVSDVAVAREWYDRVFES